MIKKMSMVMRFRIIKNILLLLLAHLKLVIILFYTIRMGMSCGDRK